MFEARKTMRATTWLHPIGCVLCGLLAWFAGGVPLVADEPAALQMSDLPAVVPGISVQSPEVIQAPKAIQTPRSVSIDISSIFQLTQDQNVSIAIARAKVEEACACLELAKSFSVHVRASQYQRVQAEVAVWQRRAELSKTTSEALVDATGTYVDWLAARSGAKVGKEIEEKLDYLLSQAKKLAQIDPGAKVEVSRVEGAIAAQKQAARKLQQAEVSARAKLNYLLGLDAKSPVALVMQVDPLQLVDVNQPAERLVTLAQQNGPGVVELEGMIARIEEARAQQQNSRVAQLLDPPAQMRLDDARTQQAYLSLQELRAKLELGVREAVESSRSNAELVRIGTEQVKNAEETYSLSEYRLKNNIKDSRPSEVLLSIHSLAEARSGLISAIRDHNKAQFRLHIFTAPR